MLMTCSFFIEPCFGQRTQGEDNDTTVTVRNTGNVPFVDANGDGYNDNAPDSDGDGVPDWLDADFVRRGRGGPPWWVDRDGDGIIDNMPDHDGDGIPNGRDPDFVRPRTRNSGRGFVDVDGDGIRDGRGRRRGRGMGMGWGRANQADTSGAGRRPVEAGNDSDNR